MPTYVLPAVQVFQDLQTVPTSTANPLRAHIAGGHAYLVRYAEETDERENGSLGTYDDAYDTDYRWADLPNHPAGALVDASYVKLWMKNALLEYFDNQVGDPDYTFLKSTGYRNRIYSTDFNLADNGNYDRNAVLLRDVQVNDVVRVNGTATSGEFTLWTYVQDLIGETDAASFPATGTADSGNVTTHGASQSYQLTTTDLINNVDLTVGTAWDGLAAGRNTDVYTIRVTRGSEFSDATTARLSVRTASGEDEVAEVTPAAFGQPTTIGELGLKVTFHLDNTQADSESAENEGIPAVDFVEGQSWDVTVTQAWTATTAAVTGTYEYTDDTTYLVEVIRGGYFAGAVPPQIRVTTNNGIDLSGPTTVTAAGLAVNLGTRGLLVSFGASTGLAKGDRWTVVVLGQSEGAMRTMVLGHNLPTDLNAEVEVGITLYIPKALLQIGQNRVYLEGTGSDPVTNWDVTDEMLTVKSGIIAYDESWASGGVQQHLHVKSDAEAEYGQLYVEYRAWRSDLAYELGTISDVSTINDAIVGALDPDNPLKWGVFKALENSNGVDVKFTAVANPASAESWADMMEQLIGRDDVYGLVPLTRDRDVLDLYAAHVDAMSTPEQGLWRVCWFSLDGMAEIPVVHNGSTVSGHLTSVTGNTEALCTFAKAATAEESESGQDTAYIVECPAGNSDFITNSVRSGDILRTHYADDGFGNITYDSYIVDHVVSEHELHLVAGPTAAESTPIKIEVWRNLTKTEEAEQIALNAGSWDNRRIRAVWPDSIESGGTEQEGYFLCAALAGEASGILPHQGMTNLEVLGFDRVPRTTRFNRPQLDTMAGAGVWIVTQNPITGQVYTRHALTTGAYGDLNQSEEMLTRNVDSISFRFKDYFRPYIGVSNVTPSMRDLLEFEVRQLVDVLKTERFTRELGGQLIDATVVRLSVDIVNKDRYVLILNCTVPYALNVFEVHLVI